jgi:hypothetical protein
MKFKPALIIAIAINLSGCGGQDRLANEARIKQINSEVQAFHQRKASEAQARQSALSELERLRSQRQISTAEYWRRTLKVKEGSPIFLTHEREFYMVMIEVATRFDNNIITPERYSAEHASAMTRFEAHDRAIEAARNNAAFQANQAAISVQNAYQAKRQADTDAAIRMLGVAADLARPTVVSNPALVSPVPGPRIYNFNGRQTICSTTGSITNCN